MLEVATAIDTKKTMLGVGLSKPAAPVKKVSDGSGGGASYSSLRDVAEVFRVEGGEMMAAAAGVFTARDAAHFLKKLNCETCKEPMAQQWMVCFGCGTPVAADRLWACAECHLPQTVTALGPKRDRVSLSCRFKLIGGCGGSISHPKVVLGENFGTTEYAAIKRMIVARNERFSHERAKHTPTTPINAILEKVKRN